MVPDDNQPNGSKVFEMSLSVRLLVKPFLQSYPFRCGKPKKRINFRCVAKQCRTLLYGLCLGIQNCNLLRGTPAEGLK